MFRTKRHYLKIAREMQMFQRGIRGWKALELRIKIDVSELAEILQEEISKHGLEIVPEENAKMVCVAFTQYPDNSGYDLYGIHCFVGNPSKIDYRVNYCGLMGDVNTVDVTDQEFVRFFVR